MQVTARQVRTMMPRWSRPERWMWVMLMMAPLVALVMVMVFIGWFNAKSRSRREAKQVG